MLRQKFRQSFCQPLQEDLLQSSQDQSWLSTKGELGFCIVAPYCWRQKSWVAYQAMLSGSHGWHMAQCTSAVSLRLWTLRQLTTISVHYDYDLHQDLVVSKKPSLFSTETSRLQCYAGSVFRFQLVANNIRLGVYNMIASSRGADCRNYLSTGACGGSDQPDLWFVVSNLFIALPLSDLFKLVTFMTTTWTIDAWYHCKEPYSRSGHHASHQSMPDTVYCMPPCLWASNTCRCKVEYFWASMKFKVSTYIKIGWRHNFNKLLQDLIPHSWLRNTRATACVSSCVSIWMLGVHSEGYSKSRCSSRLTSISTGYDCCTLRQITTETNSIAALLTLGQAFSLSLGHHFLSLVKIMWITSDTHEQYL